MKNLLSIILLFSPIVLLSQTIVSTSPENKNAIVEESTGIHCSYCPDGHAILNQVVEQNPNDVFVIKFHEGGYAWDCDPNGGHDFNNDIANQLGVMGQATGQPSASVNRQVFPSYSMTAGGTAMSRGSWAAAINSVTSESSYVNVGVEASIEGNQLEVHVELYYTSNSPVASNFINIAILQNETIGPQMGSEFNPDYRASNAPNPDYAHGEYDYRHMNRMVDMINGLAGDQVTETSQGSFIDRTYTYTLPTFYNDVAVDISQIEIVAFVTDGNEIITGSGADASYQLPPYDLSLNSIDSPSGSGFFTENEYVVVTITNNGENEVSNFDISYQVNNGSVVTETYTGTLASGSSIQYSFNATYDFSQAGDYTITAYITYESDEIDTNNSSSTTITAIEAGDCPDEYELPIVWRENFECYDPFAIDNIEGWTIIDNDGGTTWGANGVDFTNESYVGAGIIFNYPLATPVSGDASIWNTYEGNQGLYFFASGANATTIPNDDWMISPEFSMDGVTSPILSFWAKSLTDQYGLERFQIGVGTTTNPSDFTIITPGSYVEPPTQWTQYQYDLSAYEGQNIRLAIHYMGNDSFVLMMDNFVIEGTLGVTNYNSLEMSLYPNPVDQNYVTIETPISGSKEIEVFDLLGKKVIDVNSSSNQLDISQLNSGVYMVRVTVGNQSSTTKLIVE